MTRLLASSQLIAVEMKSMLLANVTCAGQAKDAF